MKRRGFTLIELLAVIVILAVIALIATPMIMNVIEKSRKGAAENSGYGYIEAVEWHQVQSQVDSNMYQIPKNEDIMVNDCEGKVCISNVISVKGEKPTGENDYIRLNDKGIIEEGKLTFNGYEVIVKDGKVESSNKVGTVEKKVEPFVLAMGPSTFVIDETGNLWSWGMQINGQMEENPEVKLNPVLIKEGAKLKSVVNFAGIPIPLNIEGILDIKDIDPKLMEMLEGFKPFFEKKFKMIIAGPSSSSHQMAIDAEGNLWGWGENVYGQLGDGTTENKNFPIQIKEGTKFQSVSVGQNLTMAIDTEGNLWSWGSGVALGYNATEYCTNNLQLCSKTPTIVQAGIKFKDVSLEDSYAIAIDVEGNLWSWGSNRVDRNFGILGDGTEIERRDFPAQIMKGTKFKSISTAKYNTMAIDVEGNLWTWGTINWYGQMGVEGFRQGEPTKVLTGTKFRSVSAGDSHTVAIDTENNIWTWGNNSDGELGNGTTEDSSVPIKITLKK